MEDMSSCRSQQYLSEINTFYYDSDKKIPRHKVSALIHIFLTWFHIHSRSHSRLSLMTQDFQSRRLISLTLTLKFMSKPSLSLWNSQDGLKLYNFFETNIVSATLLSNLEKHVESTDICQAAHVRCHITSSHGGDKYSYLHNLDCQSMCELDFFFLLSPSSVNPGSIRDKYKNKKKPALQLLQGAPIRRVLGSIHVPLQSLLRRPQKVDVLCNFGLLWEESAPSGMVS